MDMMNGITVLSLFDGMSCGQQALQRAGIKVNKYYASEIEKHPITVTQHNFPKTARYKMLGNGWTVDVIAHIFQYLKEG